MKYYTGCISTSLAEKLKENGMPIKKAVHPERVITYGRAFDWLMEKNISIRIHTYPAREPFAWGYMIWTMDGMALYDPNPAPETMKLNCYPTWHDAANAAIEKALTLI